MNYLEMMATMEENKISLMKMLEKKNLSNEEYEAIQNSIENYDYIIELIEMNHFERGYKN